MAAVMAAGMTPPLGLALATTLFPNRWLPDEHEAGKPAYVLGLSFITEGAIPFAARDPLRVIPALHRRLGGGRRHLARRRRRRRSCPTAASSSCSSPTRRRSRSSGCSPCSLGTAITTAVLFFTKRPDRAARSGAVAHRRRRLTGYGAANSSSWMLSGSWNTTTNAPGIVLAGATGEHVTPSFASRAAHASSSSRPSTAKAR